ncbi:hypothetical protein BGZ54_006437 [Gamsiella multidivaricata]|nr:hypothetical protein BGZ54_006437 [Gamsiella multidivaricata]
MATTATTTSTAMTLPVVGRSTMSLVGTSSPPTTPPATPTSPMMSSSTLPPSDPAKEATADVATSTAPAKVQAVMVATPPPSPPPASLLTTLLPLTPFPLGPGLDAPLTVPITLTGLDNDSGLSISTEASIAEPVVASGGSIASSVTVESAPETVAVSMPSSAEATTFFDDMINAPQPPANILTLSPTTSLPDLYHDFFDNHPELYDSDLSSDPEMDLDDPEDMIRARTMADLRQTAAATTM